jgi:hypothetical protein
MTNKKIFELKQKPDNDDVVKKALKIIKAMESVHFLLILWHFILFKCND